MATVNQMLMSKGNAVYKAHSYPTKVPYPAIMRFLLQYTRPGDVVLDGFAGSGSTGVAAQACGAPDRKASSSGAKSITGAAPCAPAPSSNGKTGPAPSSSLPSAQDISHLPQSGMTCAASMPAPSAVLSISSSPDIPASPSAPPESVPVQTIPAASG